MIEETDLAYLAGLIDGEGSISIFVHRGRHRLTLQIYNTNPTIMEWIKDVFGGRVHVIKRQRPGCKQEYTWIIGCHKGAKLLECCLPYLKIKKMQAELFIAHVATSAHWGRAGIPTDIRKKREEILNCMKVLNRRGTDLKEQL